MNGVCVLRWVWFDHQALGEQGKHNQPFLSAGSREEIRDCAAVAIPGHAQNNV